MPPIVLKGLIVLPCLNLLQGFIGRLVKFEFKDIDVVLCLDEHIHPSICSMTFHFGIETYHLEDYPDCILEEPPYSENDNVKHFTCCNQLLALTFGQFSNRENIRHFVVT
jgi:hypothetical protein